MQRRARAWYSSVPRRFQAISSSLRLRLTLAGAPITRLCGGQSNLALTKAAAETMERAPMCA